MLIALGALGSTANARAGGAQGKEAHPHVIGDVSRPVPAKARSAAPLALHDLDGVLDHQPISSGDPLVDMGHAGDGTGGHQLAAPVLFLRARWHDQSFCSGRSVG